MNYYVDPDARISTVSRYGLTQIYCRHSPLLPFSVWSSFDWTQELPGLLSAPP